jgi:Putative Flp pilus-assembly TadE/G-like
VTRLPRPGRARDEGMISAFVVIFATALVGVTALVLDGGRMLAAHRQANYAADSAARAGAQAISQQAVYDGADVILDPVVAHDKACDLLDRAGYPCGGGTQVTVSGNEVQVEVEGSIDMSMLPIGSQTVGGEGSACVVRGITDAVATC